MADFNFYFLTESLISYAFLQSAQQFGELHWCLVSVLHLLVNPNGLLLLIFRLPTLPGFFVFLKDRNHLYLKENKEIIFVFLIIVTIIYHTV